MSIAFIQNLIIFDNLTTMSPNVPVVNDGLPARIGALRSKDQGWQTVLE
jgi:hypothetical protein